MLSKETQERMFHQIKDLKYWTNQDLGILRYKLTNHIWFEIHLQLTLLALLPKSADNERDRKQTVLNFNDIFIVKTNKIDKSKLHLYATIFERTKLNNKDEVYKTLESAIDIICKYIENASYIINDLSDDDIIDNSIYGNRNIKIERILDKLYTIAHKSCDNKTTAELIDKCVIDLRRYFSTTTMRDMKGENKMDKNIGVITEQGFVQGSGLGFSPINENELKKDNESKKDNKNEKDNN